MDIIRSYAIAIEFAVLSLTLPVFIKLCGIICRELKAKFMNWFKDTGLGIRMENKRNGITVISKWRYDAIADPDNILYI